MHDAGAERTGIGVGSTCDDFSARLFGTAHSKAIAYSFFVHTRVRYIGGTGLKRAARDRTALTTPDRCAYVNLAVPSRIRPGASERWPRRADLNIFRHCLFNQRFFGEIFNVIN